MGPRQSLWRAIANAMAMYPFIEIFCTGPLAYFLELRDRTSPAPLKEEEEAAEQEGDAIMGEMHESVCTEMPQAVAVVG